jgi:hypothetical protein
VRCKKKKVHAARLIGGNKNIFLSSYYGHMFHQLLNYMANVTLGYKNLICTCGTVVRPAEARHNHKYLTFFSQGLVEIYVPHTYFIKI